MRWLIDSHVFLWWVSDELKVANPAYSVLSDRTNEVFVSVATVWELSIKSALGKLHVKADWQEQVLLNRMTPIAITMRHAQMAAALPFHHRDPFDRMLIAQARTEGLTLITADARISDYDVRLLMV
ncbi:MAG: type II toxin-antitoxin system VapC family toxin [Alphaproteobacteria bacterium]